MLDFNLQLKQEQKLVMTQDLQLAVKILQLTSFELNQYIDEQLVENPMLEAEEPSIEEYDKIEEPVYEYYDEGIDYSEYQDNSEYVSPFTFIAGETSMWEYLKEQLRFMPLTKPMTKMCEYIIDNIDEAGYLTIDISDLCNKYKVSNEEAEEALDIVQSLEPWGVGARNINECLLIQVRNKGISDEILENIIQNMLEDVAQGNINKISKGNNISADKARDYIDIIRNLDPKPGIRLNGDRVRYVVPDVIVEKIDGKYIVNVNEDSLPKLKINNMYRQLINKKNSNEFRYLKERFESAVWLIKSIEHRVQTIKSVMEAIIKYQLDFFEHEQGLKPLNLKQIASEINMHESTVSRAIKGKYVQTPKGLFEIKSFFMRGIQSKSGEEIATQDIKNRIREVIEGENTKKPLSDQQICDMLNKEGFNVSRRTVAKYREEMNISSSSKRKR